jgi:uncharacterized protein (DUF1697 family)
MIQPTKYVALLRGINVGGKNIIKMSDLKQRFEAMGLADVSTYINSGNIIFSSENNSRDLEQNISAMLAREFGYTGRVAIRSAAEIIATAENIPASWHHDTDKKCNVIFLAHEIDDPEIIKQFKPLPGVEELYYYPGVLYWSALWSGITGGQMIKLSKNDIYRQMTVRNLNTTRKLAQLMK